MFALLTHLVAVSSLQNVQNSQLSRRQCLAAASGALFAVAAPPSAHAEEPIDWKGHTSCFGMAPPPVQGALKYQELLDQAAEGRFATVQIAPQHDQVIATTTKGWRYSCPIKDKDFPILLEDARRDDLTLPFEVLPMDPIRAKVHDAAILVRNVFGVLYLADQFDMLPWDTTSYGSVAEMEAAKEKRARGEVPEKGQKPLALFAKKVIAKVDEASDKEGSPLAKAKALLSSVLLALPAKKEKEKRGGKSEHDEALQRVLGLTTWDAAAELKAKMGGRRAAFKAKVSERAETQTSALLTLPPSFCLLSMP